MHKLPGAEAGLRVGGELGFDTDHFHTGMLRSQLQAAAIPLIIPPRPTGTTRFNVGHFFQISSPWSPAQR